MKILSYLKSLFSKKENSQPEPLKILVKVDRHGNKWYAYQNPLNMHKSREMELRDVEVLLECSLTPEWLKSYVERAKECINTGNILDLAIDLNAMETRLNFGGSREAYLHFCSCYYLLNNESAVEMIDPKKVEEKRKLLENDVELADFFLQDVFVRRNNFGAVLLEDFLNCLGANNKFDKESYSLSRWNEFTTKGIKLTSSASS